MPPHLKSWLAVCLLPLNQEVGIECRLMRKLLTDR